ncbi:hypothetical protein FOZ60_011054 [Perkinsus olseni]|uniref:Tyr recombinase domain-containing protein n=1 Tax=Perkinsus olseni TaxID=32597 RepID=A0A7J6NDY8_PEROL|nr:hypothetical protein FOZ60_011054 [Perkinsus olseni]
MDQLGESQARRAWQVVGPTCFPLCIEDLQLFVWVLTKANYAFNSIATFVGGLRSRNKSLGSDLSPSEAFRLKHILQAAKTATADVLGVFHNWPPKRFRGAAAMLIGICGLLRAEELLALKWEDVFTTTAEGSDSLVLGLTIKSSKTDQVAAGQTAYVACTASVLGPRDVHVSYTK